MREGYTHRPSGSIGGSSPLSARSVAKPRAASNDETELENTAILEDLRSRLAKSETAAETAAQEYAKQLKALQQRLEEANAEYVRIEEQMHVKDESIEQLELQVKDLIRSKRDQENIYEAERIAAQQEKEELLDREEELNTIVQRLKDTLSQRQGTPDKEGRNSFDSVRDGDSVTFAPSAVSPVPQQTLLLQKDKLIESLRLELAEAQISLAEADHHGGTKLQQLEQQLLEVRMTNARLMEDNESFQLLLSSAALNGDFPRGDYLSNAFSDPEQHETESEKDEEIKKVPGSPRRNSISLGLNLAEELESVDANDEAVQEENQQIKKLEVELKALREQNKAMSLYISGIIERILQSKDSEAILDKTTPLSSSNNSGSNTPANDKPLPPKPEDEPRTGILQRTKSAAQRKAPPPFRPENMSSMQRSHSYRGPTGGHKRSQSDHGHSYPSAGSVVNNIYRGEGMITPRSSTFYGGATGEHYTARARPRDSTISVDSGVSDTDASSISSRTSSHPSTPISGKTLRPLTLVQKNVSNGMMSPPLGGPRKISGDYMDGYDMNANKRSSKRSSWMGWFGRKEDGVQIATESVVFEGKDVE